MELIADKDGVDVIIPPVTGLDGLHLNIDFNTTEKILYEMDHRTRDWNLKVMDGRRHIGTVVFTAYQFMTDGLERRTISLKQIHVEPRHRGQKKSYDLVQFVLDTVKHECDKDWGEVYGKPVLFIEKQDIDAPAEDKHSIFNFIKKIGEKIFGYDSKDQPGGGDVCVTAIGDAISIGLIQEHLQRSHALRQK